MVLPVCLIDIYSRKIVAWSVEVVDSDKVARRLINTAAKRKGIDADQLTLHSDRGAQMTSTTIAELDASIASRGVVEVRV